MIKLKTIAVSDKMFYLLAALLIVGLFVQNIPLVSLALLLLYPFGGSIKLLNALVGWLLGMRILVAHGYAEFSNLQMLGCVIFAVSLWYLSDFSQSAIRKEINWTWLFLPAMFLLGIVSMILIDWQLYLLAVSAILGPILESRSK